MKTAEIRKLFLDYYVKNNHQLVASSSLIPHNDETLLFTSAGMVQFKNVFTGIEHPSYQTAVSSQKCLRAGGKHNDLDNVGYTARHHTFFEMLGNFSFGDYFKEKAIYYAWNFLTKELSLPKDKLLVTVYHNDDEAFNLWKKIAGFNDDKIIRIKTSDNFWEMGDVGPCGPCTEIFYDRGDKVAGGPPGSKDEDGDRFIEIWNLVFMQFEKVADGKLINLKKPAIDTGMGLERISAVLQNKQDNYDIDLFTNIINHTSNLFNVKVTHENKVCFKVIADHIRAATFMIVDGILPSNEGRGYVLRRILRRAIRYAYALKAKDPILYNVVNAVAEEMGAYYTDLPLKQNFVKETLKQEEIKFGETFENGIKILNQELENHQSGAVFSGKVAFKLYDTYGFPIDLTKDILKSKSIMVDEQGFQEASENHKNLGKNSWKGSGEAKDNPIWFKIAEKNNATNFVGYDKYQVSAVIKDAYILENNTLKEVNSLKEGDEGYLIFDQTVFYAELGGQVADLGFITDDKKQNKIKILDVQKRQGDVFYHKFHVEKGTFNLLQNVYMEIDVDYRLNIARNHSAIHLLYAALKKLMGNHIMQQGSMVSADRMRLDVSHNKAFTEEEILKLESIVNLMIIDNHKVVIENMELNKAIKMGAVPLFSEKYPSIARTVKIGNEESIISDFELCAGTHVAYTGEIGYFKIVAEGSIASGTRRIEAVSGKQAALHINEMNSVLKKLGKIFNVDALSLEGKVSSLIAEHNKLKKEYNNLFNKFHLEKLKTQIVNYNKIDLLLANISDVEPASLKDISNTLITSNHNLLAALFIIKDDKASFIIMVAKDAAQHLDFTTLTKGFLDKIKGNGGGSKVFLQGVGSATNVQDAKDFIIDFVKKL